jgi:hypothetical protein
MSDEPTNWKAEAEEQCKPKAKPEWLKYEQCVARITDEKTGSVIPGKNCTGYYIDYWHAIDQCALPIYSKKITF